MILGFQEKSCDKFIFGQRGHFYAKNSSYLSQPIYSYHALFSHMLLSLQCADIAERAIVRAKSFYKLVLHTVHILTVKT